jgi:PPOX class probable F420-dependent enzyme
VTTLRRDGSPHVVPMGVVVDPSSGTAWAITSRTSQKVANLRSGADPRVAVCQVDGRRWSTLEGTAEVCDDPQSVAEAVRRYAERYRQPRENPDRVAIRISITGVIGNV